MTKVLDFPTLSSVGFKDGTTPRLPHCSICNGQINVGEPVVIYNDQEGGMIISHRFKTTCEGNLS